MELTKQQEQLPAQTTPDQLLTLAVDKNLDIEKLEKLMDLRERHERNEARKAFYEAFSDFQHKSIEVRKTREAKFSGHVQYRYAKLDDITRAIKEPLKACGLLYRWEIQDDGETIKVSCIISHVQGHSEITSMSAKADTSGSKNPIQSRGSAVQYLKRYTLEGALGLSTTEDDYDGQLPDIDMDKLHKEYMDLYSSLIQIDGSLTKWHPDNWKKERTAKVYLKAIQEIKKELITRKK